jgi:hypothetical protein
MKVLAAEKIKKAANENRLQNSDHFMWLLQCWRLWEGTDSAAAWAKSFVKDPQSALTIAAAATSAGTITGRQGTRTYDTLLLKWLEQFIDIEKAWGYLCQLEKTALTDRQKRILALYERGLALKNQGKPYDKIEDETNPFL